MSETEKYGNLFSPGRIGTLETPNRIVMAPMATNYPSETGGMTDALIDYYEARAKGGTGLIIIENCCVDFPAGKAGATQLRLDADQFIPGISRLVDAVHFYGAKIALQINHAGPSALPAKTEGKGPVGATGITYAPHLPPPRKLRLDEIEELIEKFAQAAVRAKKAGFDAVEIHGCHAYLLAHFMSPLTNDREDEYGGDLEGRMRFPLQVIRKIRELLGPDYPIIFRMSGDEFIPGGRGLEESKQMAGLLAGEGVDALHVTAGTTPAAAHPSGTVSLEPMSYEQGWRIHLAEGIKSAVEIPVIAVGVIREPGFAEKILAEGRTDFVALGRSLIADPDWPIKARSGLEKSIRKCISCNEGCIKRRGGMDLPIRCTVNPEVGKPSKFRDYPMKGKAKRVLIVGGGPAGLEAACRLKGRGHDVTLWEKKDVLGGQLNIASVPIFKRKLRWFLNYLKFRVSDLSVSCELNTKATPEAIMSFSPDELILATGSVPEVPPIPGIEGAHVESVEDVLVRDYTGSGARVVVLGGGVKGAEVARFLADRGERVTMLEMLDEIASDLDPFSRKDLLSRLEEKKVRIVTRGRIVSCREHGIDLQVNGKDQIFVEADKAVSCLGYKPRNALVQSLKGRIPSIHVVGDCRRPGRIIDAISDGYQAGTLI